MKKLLMLLAVTAIAVGVQAETMIWAASIGGGDGTTFNVNNNWYHGETAAISLLAPGASDVVYIDDDLFGNPLATMPTLSAVQAVNTLLVGDGSGGALDLNTGAALDVGNWMYVGGVAGASTLNMNDGTIDIVGNLECGNLEWGTRVGGTGHINLYGGTITTGVLGMSGTGTGTMDIEAGTLIVNGDQTGAMTFLQSEGWITAYGGTGTVMMDFGVTNAGQTTLYGVIPEPATLGMVALLGGGMLWIRSRFMI